MDCWTGVLKVPLAPSSTSYCRVAVSLCLSAASKTLSVPSANAIFFNGDRVEGTENPVIERLSDLRKNSSNFDFIPSVNRYGEPKSYNPVGFPASNSTVSVLLNCLKEAKKVISRREQESSADSVSFNQPENIHPWIQQGRHRAQPAKSLLNSISEIHYVDVGLNSAGAYTTNHDVIERISQRLMQGAPGIRFVLHGTPRQWCDSSRVLIREEKDRLAHLLESESRRSGGKLQVTP
ncbi:hypothetical protein OIU84_012861 [Salix udensis]|uniref:Uncharacterized protein n=1 Tax=Salix udensis TaxID=889485 RepID=A0AAD6NTC6_9ROSI|nr:hypothetical protein OIU84_012861 [Salix udensis]